MYKEWQAIEHVSDDEKVRGTEEGGDVDGGDVQCNIENEKQNDCDIDNGDDDDGCSDDNDDDDGGGGDNDDDDGGGVTGSATVSQTRWLKIGVVEIWHSQRPLSEIWKHIIFSFLFYFVFCILI